MKLRKNERKKNYSTTKRKTLNGRKNNTPAYKYYNVEAHRHPSTEPSRSRDEKKKKKKIYFKTKKKLYKTNVRKPNWPSRINYDLKCEIGNEYVKPRTLDASFSRKRAFLAFHHRAMYFKSKQVINQSNVVLNRRISAFIRHDSEHFLHGIAKATTANSIGDSSDSGIDIYISDNDQAKPFCIQFKRKQPIVASGIAHIHGICMGDALPT